MTPAEESRRARWAAARLRAEAKAVTGADWWMALRTVARFFDAIANAERRRTRKAKPDRPACKACRTALEEAVLLVAMHSDCRKALAARRKP
mgnify:CR=1 FL=1